MLFLNKGGFLLPVPSGNEGSFLCEIADFAGQVSRGIVRTSLKVIYCGEERYFKNFPSSYFLMRMRRKLLLHELPAGLLFKMRANSLTPKYFLRAIKGYLLLSLVAGLRAIACISFRATLCLGLGLLLSLFISGWLLFMLPSVLLP